MACVHSWDHANKDINDPNDPDWGGECTDSDEGENVELTPGAEFVKMMLNCSVLFDSEYKDLLHVDVVGWESRDLRGQSI